MGGQGGAFPLVSLVVVAASLGWAGVGFLDAGVGGMVMGAACLWADLTTRVLTVCHRACGVVVSVRRPVAVMRWLGVLHLGDEEGMPG